MTLVKSFLAITFTINFAAAQNLSHPVMASRADAFSTPRQFRSAPDTIDLLAVMVQFQIDTDTRTTGNGQFDLSNPAEIGLDSPPHNRRYFEDHLTFLANYYRKVSKGKTLIRATLIDTVFTLAAQMARYSPPKSGPNTVVGDLARDTWTQVSTSGRVPDFSRYECFVVFHAGVGRDVDLTATIGFDPTPLDIPSLYIGLNAFKSFYGETYAGIPVRNNFRITNTIIMPETETREIPATPTNFTLRLGINGLLCASVGNYLGLPDLFNTSDGRSGIGRFGLMDGQSIFSFAGAFPPEPSAWEKYWLGWIQPIVLPSGTYDVVLPATSTSDRSDRVDTVYRVPVSASEYFLIENRNRDWARNGQRVTLSYNGIISQKSYQRDTVGFNASNLSDIRGNVIDVDDFDWSLPGGVSATTNEFFDGGILIWHIDETVIAQGLATNGVNANPTRRGVDVEEADGSQDIGQSYGQLEPGSGSEEGTALDFWFQGNIAPVYRNEFSATSYPNNASNSGANSHFSVREISRRATRMTARIILGDEQVKVLRGFPKSLAQKIVPTSLTVADLGPAVGQSLLVLTDFLFATKPLREPVGEFALAGIYAWKPDGTGAVRSSSGEFAFATQRGGEFIGSPAVRDLNGDGIAEVVVNYLAPGLAPLSFARAYSAAPSGPESLATVFFNTPFSTTALTAPVISDSAIVLGGANGYGLSVSFSGSVIDTSRRLADTIVGVSRTPNPRAFIATTRNGLIALIESRGTTEPTRLRDVRKRIVGPAVSGIVANEERIACSAADGSVFLFDRNLVLSAGFPVATGSAMEQSPALADIDADGNRDIIVFAGNKIFAYNYAGALLDNFPRQIPSPKSITSNPVVADVDGDGDVDIVAVSEDGLVVAYDKNGQLTRGFPLQAGIGSQSVAAFAVRDTVMLAVASSEDGSVAAWRTGVARGTPSIPWGQYQRDAQHTGLATEPIAGTPVSTAFFPKDRAYNWPNPVTDGKTFIRYFVNENATVKIRIFDLAGDLVTEMSAPGIGGVDNEVEWNVGGVQSGVYLARIEASGGGKNETAIVKVAVVK